MTKFLSLEALVKRAPSVATKMPVPDASAKYTHVNTLEIAQMLEEIGWFPVRAREQVVRDAVRQGFQKHEVVFRYSHNPHVWRHLPEEHRIEQDNADEIAELIIHNSHDRRSPWTLFGGMMVQVCANGLVVSRATFQEARIPHVNVTRGEILATVNLAAGRMADVMLLKDEMKLVDLNDDQRIKFAEKALDLKYQDRALAPVSPRVLLEPRRDADKGNSLWKTYQVVQENAVRGLQRDTSRVDMFGRPFGLSMPVASIDRCRTYNQELWDLTLSYMNN